jgi:hypothetical protein
MADRFLSGLPFRLGCPLALLLAAAGGVSVEALVHGRPIRGDSWDSIIPFGLFVGFPFGVLALAKARDWLAWLLAAVLMAGLWVSRDYMIESSTDFMSGIPFTMAPLAIAGLCLAVAGMRGRIPWAREGDGAGVED